jgi:hypothetical protein
MNTVSDIGVNEKLSSAAVYTFWRVRARAGAVHSLQA